MESERKRKNRDRLAQAFVLAIVACLLSVVIWGPDIYFRVAYNISDLPSGYRLLVSDDDEKVYSVFIPEDDYVGGVSVNSFESKSGAIRYAISWHNYINEEPKPTKEREWKEVE